MSRTYKKPYTGSKRFDPSCRNDGEYSYCRSNRTHKNVRRMQESEDELLAYEEEEVETLYYVSGN